MKAWTIAWALAMGMGAAGAARAENLPDVSQAQLASVERAFGCSNASSAESRLGCEFLAAFMRAKAPDPELLKQPTPLRGKRWLGVSIVVGHASKHEWLKSAETVPRAIALVLGTRFDSGFHRKLYFSNGVSVTYIWPTNETQGSQVKDITDRVTAGRPLPNTHPLVEFAEATELNFRAFGDTSGSLLIDQAIFLRQQGQFLYVLEIGGRDENQPKYWVSRVALRDRVGD